MVACTTTVVVLVSIVYVHFCAYSQQLFLRQTSIDAAALYPFIQVQYANYGGTTLQTKDIYYIRFIPDAEDNWAWDTRAPAVHCRVACHSTWRLIKGSWRCVWAA